MFGNQANYYWSSTASTTAWTAWTVTYNTAVTSATNLVWTNWANTGAANYVITAGAGTADYYPAARTHEQAAELAARADRERVARVVAEGERQKARERADILLRSALAPKQLADLADKGYFFVESIDGRTGQRKRYRIDRGNHRNVREVDANDRVLRTFCAYPHVPGHGAVPDGDAMLAQKLLLEAAPEAFFKVANEFAHEPPAIRHDPAAFVGADRAAA